jgi:hypothetical protein
MAAVLAAGPQAVASHRCGAAIWRILASDQLGITVPRLRIVPGIVVRLSHVPDDELTRIRNVPVTTVPRTVVDLAAVVRGP